MPYATMQYNSNQQQPKKEDENQPLEVSSTATARLQTTSRSSSSRHHSSNKKASAVSVHPDELLPTVASEIPLGAPPLLDGKTELQCGSDSSSSSSSSSSQAEPQLVHGEVELTFGQSDYTWLVFVSRPVYVQCVIPAAQAAPEFVPGQPVASAGVVFALQFLDAESSHDDQSDLVIRMALANDCTHGTNPMSCGRAGSRDGDHVNQTAYTSLLRQHADLYPGPDTDVSFDFVKNETTGETVATHLKFNWNVQSMKHGEIFDDQIDNQADTVPVLEGGSKGELQMKEREEGKANLLMYALPHHQDMIEESSILAASQQDKENQESSFPTYTVPGDEHSDTVHAKFCKSSLIGPACLIEGSTWALREEHKWTSFRAPRPPQNDTLPALAKAFRADVKYTLPSYYQRGAGDTVRNCCRGVVKFCLERNVKSNPQFIFLLS